MAARFAHAYPLSTSKGVLSGVVYGLFGFIRRFLVRSRYKYNRICFVFDSRPKFRYDIYPEYKQQRKIDRAKSEEQQNFYEIYIEQLGYLKEILKGLNIIAVELKDYEADDAVYKIQKELQGEEFVLYSNDKDYIQMVGGKSVVAAPNFQAVNERYIEIRPKKYLLQRLMIGDTSDSIKGVMGIGEKRAAEIVELVGESRFSLFMRNLKKSGKWYEKLWDNKEILKRNYELMSLSYAYRRHTHDKKLLYVKSRFSISAFNDICKRFELRVYAMESDIFQRLLINLKGDLPGKNFRAVESIT